MPTMLQVKARYRLWRCDDGSYDVLDSEGEPDDGPIYYNLGRDETSAWAILLAIINQDRIDRLSEMIPYWVSRGYFDLAHEGRRELRTLTA